MTDREGGDPGRDGPCKVFTEEVKAVGGGYTAWMVETPWDVREMESEKKAKEYAAWINRALQPLVARAALVDRMARVLYEASARCFCTKRQIQDGHRPECATPDIERVLSDYALLSTTEGRGKNEA